MEKNKLRKISKKELLEIKISPDVVDADDIEMLKTNSPLYVRCKFHIKTTTKEFCDYAEKQGILLIPANSREDFPEIAFSVASVGIESLENAVKMLKNVVRNS